jgi:hypothetical protein
MWHIHTIGAVVQRRTNHIVCKKMDGSGDHHVKRNNADSQRQVSHVFSYM